MTDAELDELEALYRECVDLNGDIKCGYAHEIAKSTMALVAEVRRLRAERHAALADMADAVGNCCHSRPKRERGWCESFGCSSVVRFAEKMGAAAELAVLVKPIAKKEAAKRRYWNRRFADEYLKRQAASASPGEDGGKA